MTQITLVRHGQANSNARDEASYDRLSELGWEPVDSGADLVIECTGFFLTEETCQKHIDAGAKKVFFASAAPPVRYPNVYGIDMPVAEELIAHNRSEEEICELLGADGLIYQTLEDLEAACLEGNPKIDRFDSSCFSNEYVTDVPKEYFMKIGAQRSDDAKQ